MRDPHVLRLGAVDRVAENPATRSAMRIHPLPARLAFPARADARDEHAVAFAERRHLRTDSLDDADAFVAENPARRDRRHVALHDVQVRAADRRRRDAHQRIPGTAKDRSGLRLPRPLSGAEVDQRLHHVFGLDTGRHGVAGGTFHHRAGSCRFNRPHDTSSTWVPSADHSNRNCHARIDRRVRGPFCWTSNVLGWTGGDSSPAMRDFPHR